MVLIPIEQYNHWKSIATSKVEVGNIIDTSSEMPSSADDVPDYVIKSKKSEMPKLISQKVVNKNKKRVAKVVKILTPKKAILKDTKPIKKKRTTPSHTKEPRLRGQVLAQGWIKL